LRENNSRKLQTGTEKVLVIRAVASDASTTASESELSDDIFGTSGDVVNLKSQYALCSDGKLQFEPLTTNSLVGTDGVYTVNLPTTVIMETDIFEIENAMANQALSDLGPSLDRFPDFVMLCVPKGNNMNRLEIAGYAYINYWLSVYDDIYCQDQMTQLQAIGKYLCSY